MIPDGVAKTGENALRSYPKLKEQKSSYFLDGRILKRINLKFPGFCDWKFEISFNELSYISRDNGNLSICKELRTLRTPQPIFRKRLTNRFLYDTLNRYR